MQFSRLDLLVILTTLLKNGKGGKGLLICMFVAKAAKTTCKKKLAIAYRRIGGTRPVLFFGR